MIEGISWLTLEKDDNEMLYQKIRWLRWSGPLPRITQPTKTDCRRNRLLIYKQKDWLVI